MVFVKNYDRAPGGYREVWRWIATVILPIISPRWSSRVDAGPAGKLQNNFWSWITTGDVAFVFTMIQWGARKWVKGDELELHDRKMAEIERKRLSEVKVKIEQFAADDGASCFASLDSKITVGGRGVLENTVANGQDGDHGQRNDDEKSNDATHGECDAGQAEKDTVTPEKKARGRRKGEDGFGSAKNVELFGSIGKKIETALKTKNSRGVADAWTEQAMMWVNMEANEVCSDDEEESEDDCRAKKKTKRSAPFVPQDQSKFANW